jgi:uncharacterized protein (TIGR03435 family)
LIQFANGVYPRQITGPAWIDSERYAATIKADQEGAPNIPQERVLMQKLLADRFKSLPTVKRRSFPFTP